MGSKTSSLLLGGESGRPSGVSPHQFFSNLPVYVDRPKKYLKCIQLLAVDHSARASMKNAASCEN